MRQEKWQRQRDRQQLADRLKMDPSEIGSRKSLAHASKVYHHRLKTPRMNLSLARNFAQRVRDGFTIRMTYEPTHEIILAMVEAGEAVVYQTRETVKTTQTQFVEEPALSFGMLYGRVVVRNVEVEEQHTVWVIEPTDKSLQHTRTFGKEKGRAIDLS